MTRNWKFPAHRTVQPPSDTFTHFGSGEDAALGRANSRVPMVDRMTPKHYSSVLIVDDDPVFRTTLEAFFKRHGAKNIVHAWEGIEAYAALSKGQRIDLIVLDLNMPELDGIEFLALLKERRLNLPLLVISSASEVTIRSAEVLAKVYGLNFLGAMSKPVDFDKLREVLNITTCSP